MTKFITLNMYLVQNARKDSGPSIETTAPFLEWKEGFKVRGKNGGETWTIKAIKDGTMSYKTRIQLVSENEEEVKELSGSTLQSGYVFVSGDSATQKKLTTRPMTLEVESISRFYARKAGRPGTRIIFKDKVAYIFDNPFEEVNALVVGTGAQAAAGKWQDAPADSRGDTD